MENLRKSLYPFAVVYKMVTAVRNSAYAKGWFSSTVYNLPLIGIGNLSTGGTGKSPMTEYIVRLLQDNYKLATLSRGYGRKTTGYRELNVNDLASEVGDEPLQFKQKFPKLRVAVDEKRVHGVNQLLKKPIKPEVILLDDVYQHRSIKPGFLILLTSYDSLFYNDLVLPAGNLRESRSGASRANVVVVTKCPQDLKKYEQSSIAEKIRIYTNAPVFFSKISYDSKIYGAEELPIEALKKYSLTVVTGIAKPKPFIDFLKKNNLKFEHKVFPDHHAFSSKEIAYLDSLKTVLTTEKDYVRLKPHLKHTKLYYLPIKTEFLDGKKRFDQLIKQYCTQALK